MHWTSAIGKASIVFFGNVLKKILTYSTLVSRCNKISLEFFLQSERYGEALIWFNYSLGLLIGDERYSSNAGRLQVNDAFV